MLFCEFVCASHPAQSVRDSAVHTFAICHENEGLLAGAMFSIFTMFSKIATAFLALISVIQMLSFDSASDQIVVNAVLSENASYNSDNGFFGRQWNHSMPFFKNLRNKKRGR